MNECDAPGAFSGCLAVSLIDLFALRATAKEWLAMNPQSPNYQQVLTALLNTQIPIT